MDAIVLDTVKGHASSMLDNLVTRIGQEIVLLWGFKSNLKDLQDKLIRVRNLLSRAESKFQSGSNENEDLRDWVNNIAEVVYRAENLVEEYAYEVQRRKLAKRDWNEKTGLLRLKAKIRFLFCLSCSCSSSNPMVLRFRMAHEVKSLEQTIADEVYGEADKLGIKLAEFPTANSSGSTPTSAAVIPGGDGLTLEQLQAQRQHVDQLLIGRDHFKAEITETLQRASKSDKQLTVIGICGMAGLGKTTLCKNIYETTEVKQCFEKRIWICVSHDFKFPQLLRDVMEQLGEKQSTISSIEAIKQTIQTKLQGNKYLLVLDDVWSTFKEFWEPVRSCLQGIEGSKGNTILVTSREKGVLESLTTCNSPTGMEDPIVRDLPKLTDSESLNLLTVRVKDDLSDPTKADLVEKLLKRCDGVPLAIVGVSSLLHSKKSIDQWREIEESEIWKEESIKILPSVKLSFMYLPSIAVKKCFVYCAIFEEDEVLDKNRLIRLWMAQGFLEDPQHDMEEVGEKYFDVLANNALFQNFEFDKWGNVKSCTMHDAVRALAQELSKHFTRQVQHVHLSEPEQDDQKLERSGYSRTLFLSFHPIKLPDFKMIKYLRALSLARVGLRELPDSIGELKHLRYLDISSNYEMKSLPDGFTKLYNLQTLRACDMYDLPMFPKGLGKLVNLRHIDNDEGTMGIPVGLGKLTCLQTLPEIDASQGWGGKLSEMRTLTNLKGALSISGLHGVGIQEATEAKLGTKTKIQQLVLQIGFSYDVLFAGCSDEDEREREKEKIVLEALQPHSNLTSLSIVGYGGEALPRWVSEMTGCTGSPFRNLVSLYFENFENIEHLNISFKNLAALKELEIYACINAVTPPNDWECLTSLQSLSLSTCDKMQDIVSDITPLVNLKKATITGCKAMSRLPTGLSNLSSLERLWIGPFRGDLEMFPFPEPYVESDYTGASLNGCCSQLPSSLMECSSSFCNTSKHDKIYNKKTTQETTTIIRGTFFKSLVVLSLDGSEMDQVKSLPSLIQFLHKLTTLCICSFRGLESLPEWLGNLTSLRELQLQSLPNLKCFPSKAAMGHLTQLTSLLVEDCPTLKEECDKETGSEWPKIQHIPHLIIRDGLNR